MSERDSDLDSVNSSGASLDYESMPDAQEEQQVNTVREAVKGWKLRELEQNTQMNKKANGLDPLRNYVAKSARLFYDLQKYLTTEQNKDENMNDTFYMEIIRAIGSPAAVTLHFRTLLQSMLERDLIELPLTVEPKVVNTYTTKGLTVNTNFPDEE